MKKRNPMAIITRRTSLCYVPRKESVCLQQRKSLPRSVVLHVVAIRGQYHASVVPLASALALQLHLRLRLTVAIVVLGFPFAL